MRPPEEVDRVEWATLSDAMGEAELVPQYLRTVYATYGEPGEASEDALSDLLSCLCCDWRDTKPFPIAVELVPFLAHTALHLPSRREDVLFGLATVAEQTQRPSPLSGPVAAVLREAGAELLPCLADPDVMVRLALLRLLALVGGPVPTAVVDAVRGVRENDDEEEVRATAFGALARLDPDPGRGLAREREALGDPSPSVRLTASLAALRRSGPPYPEDVLAEIASTGAKADEPGHRTHFLGGPGRRRQTIDTLTSDPDAALAVAERWIAGGDLDRRGSSLAESVDHVWRDREAEVVPLLVAAVGQAGKREELYRGIVALGRTAGRLADPGPQVREALMSCTDHADLHVRDAALTSLARFGDERVLSERFALPSSALVPFAGRLDALPQIGAALLHASREVLGNPPEDTGGWPNERSRYLAEQKAVVELVQALAPEPAARLVPELTDLLGHWSVKEAAAQALGGIRMSGNRATAPELIGLLRTLGRATRPDRTGGLRVAAAVAVARLVDRTMPDGVHGLREGGAGARDQALALVGKLVAGEVSHEVRALEQVHRLGAVGLPLLPVLRDRLAANSGKTRLAAAVAYWRISRDPTHPTPVATALVEEALFHVGVTRQSGDIDTALGALELLAEMGEAPEQLRERLDRAVTAPGRFVQPIADRPLGAELDERLRSAGRLLLEE
ncbi:hypothetical protein [Streptacidiphilus jiangxiensis]|uniref:HEAT repeat associated with sister chromatid cohesion n=1 Tax=Streptacidiphilus jiangxiensis TaxID=235985 RepID=A0A1H7QGI5_STRJI|nr:hypothetical protein [Streptacidiphilus jiangxiensis]SEL46909.1 HEAT repeat associated with sister chromatid cohesion [Streptacidiphilus jiangxiensis]